MGTFTSTTRLRARFAVRLSALYATEVPAYQRLVDVSAQVNADVLREDPGHPGGLGSVARVTAERHGAVRVGTPGELVQLARILEAFGMFPVGFYDLRDAAPTPIPVVSTAFRPIDAHELAQNPFRLFVSVLVPEDRRFFTPGLAARVQEFLAGRTLFPPRLLELAERARADGGLDRPAADELLTLAVASLELDDEPIDRGWYEELQQVSSVAADIAGVPSTHINHLTPRVLDIDALHARMTALGVRMLDRIEGPPRWAGPDVLLRQTSFRALDERRLLREPDGTVVAGALRVRFGEVEARGVALTPAGRERYDAALACAADRSAPGRPTPAVLADCWAEHFPGSSAEMARWAIGHYTFTVDGGRAAAAPQSLTALLDEGRLTAHPIVYEDFLPRSAAGIFQSNLDGRGATRHRQEAAPRDVDWLCGVLDRPVHDPQQLYRAQTDRSLAGAAEALGLRQIRDDRRAAPRETVTAGIGPT